MGDLLQNTREYQNPQCSSLFHKIGWHLHISYAHPLVYSKSSRGDLEYLTQCQCHVNSCCIVLFCNFCFFIVVMLFFKKLFWWCGWIRRCGGRRWRADCASHASCSSDPSNIHRRTTAREGALVTRLRGVKGAGSLEKWGRVDGEGASETVNL